MHQLAWVPFRYAIFRRMPQTTTPHSQRVGGYFFLLIMTTEKPYQELLEIEGVNDAEDEYDEDLMKYMKFLRDLGFVELTLGFCTEADEGGLRHVLATVKPEEGSCLTDVCPTDSTWPSGYDMSSSSWDLWNLFANYDTEAFIHVHPMRYKIEQGRGLYITEPELRDDSGDEVFWNYAE